MMELNTKRNKIILGLVVLGIILIVLITTLSVLLTRSSCQFISEIPEHEEYKPVKSQNNRALAIFFGYLVYNFEDESGRIYMPLEFKSVGLITLFDQGERRMFFNTDCSNIELTLATKNDSISYFVNGISVKLVRPNGVSKVCKVYDSLTLGDIGGSTSDHYACYQKQVYDCYDNDVDRLVAKLVIEGLEFEVDGDKRQISEESFSTTAKYCQKKQNVNRKLIVN